MVGVSVGIGVRVGVKVSVAVGVSVAKSPLKGLLGPVNHKITGHSSQHQQTRSTVNEHYITLLPLLAVVGNDTAGRAFFVHSIDLFSALNIEVHAERILPELRVFVGLALKRDTAKTLPDCS